MAWTVTEQRMPGIIRQFMCDTGTDLLLLQPSFGDHCFVRQGRSYWFHIGIGWVRLVGGVL